ncbi:MAG: hypothetical protein MHM6MM_006915 [Cercozoa sp. M6MM]
MRAVSSLSVASEILSVRALPDDVVLRGCGAQVETWRGEQCLSTFQALTGARVHNLRLCGTEINVSGMSEGAKGAAVHVLAFGERQVVHLRVDTASGDIARVDAYEADDLVLDALLVSDKAWPQCGLEQQLLLQHAAELDTLLIGTAHGEVQILSRVVTDTRVSWQLRMRRPSADHCLLYAMRLLPRQLADGKRQLLAACGTVFRQLLVIDALADINVRSL